MLAIVNSTISKTPDLQKATDNFQIAQSYFSDILNSQLIIFSLIVTVVVAIIVGLYFFFNKQVSKEQIKKEVKDGVKEIREEIRKEFEEKNEQIKNKFVTEISRHDYDIMILRGEISRQMGQFWDSQKTYSTAFIWWIRAADNFARTKDEKMTRIALNSAKDAIEKIQYASEINYDILGEYQRLFSEIDDGIYKIEKDSLDKAIKNALNK